MQGTELDKDKIYKQFYEKVLHYVRKNVSKQSEVEDIVSEIFIKVFSNLDKYDSKKASLSTWIYLISSRTVVDFYRRGSKFSAVVPIDSQSENQIGIASISAQDEADAKLLKDETLDLLAAALKKLDVRERDLIVLKYYKKESLKTIAEMMNMSYSNTKIVHKRALCKLKEILSGK